MKNIALAMSGEGYRALAFSFGALSYPNNVRYGDHYLLKNVTFVSSTSGSSITPIACSAALCLGHAFSMIYYLLLHATDA
ncbi:hypothetical protein MTO98_31930 [Mucilaginibacter sp. SMC90]|uniref:hypothetical protein n=1 Tax=Mucilaginibacter sp. SMC90 TaxID=2929803 RepID=UPI001FB2C6EE|nr:hypothetical protein [Mucilaginibacter sp. SMC90]UOE49010.1 hypothetical protein MTO98_31930 [Mucilaginibacter sp. SMC90]